MRETMSSAQPCLAREAAYDVARARVAEAAQRHEHVLDFSDIGNLSELPPLTDLDRLTWLGLDGTQISDLTPLALSTSLEWLTFDGTQVTDLTPLANLASLHELSFADTRVSDLAPLGKLTLLKRRRPSSRSRLCGLSAYGRNPSRICAAPKSRTHA
jgi:hypothetical protein